MTETDYPPVPCPYCGEDYTADGDRPSDGYMYEGHIGSECEEVPEDVRWEFNKPPEPAED